MAEHQDDLPLGGAIQTITMNQTIHDQDVHYLCFLFVCAVCYSVPTTVSSQPAVSALTLTAPVTRCHYTAYNACGAGQISTNS